MEQYIPKSALVAEIENYKKSIEEDGEHCSLVVGKHKGQKMASEHFLSFINILEVKEVDLEKIVNSFIKENLTGNNPIYTKGAVACILDKFAKHFFELGLKAQKGE